MALKDRVEDFTGTFSDTAALNAWLLESARRHIDLSPPAKLSQYTQSKTVTLPTPSQCRVLEVFRVGVRARKGSPADQYLYADQKSLEYASAEDPAYYIAGDAIVLLPALTETADATTGAVTIDYPTVIDCSSDLMIANTPTELTDLVVLDTAIRATHQLLGILSTELTNLGTHLNTEEDIELAAANMQEIQTKIANYRAKLAGLQETYMMSLGGYTGRIMAQKETAQ
jgi:hypothetical protein